MATNRLILGICLVAVLSGCIPSVTPANTPEPTFTVPPGSTPSETPLPSTTPLPTQIPEVRVSTGDQAFFNGDYNTALAEYQAAFDTSSDPAVRAAALWGIGRVQYEITNYGIALVSIQQLVREYPVSPNAARAYFLMGDIFMLLQRYIEAALAYTAYINLQPGVIDALVQERIGDAYNSAGEYTKAIGAYKLSIAASHTGDNTALQIKIARAYVSQGDTVTALQLFDAISAATSNDYVKAQMDLLSGQVYLSLGKTDLAYHSFLDAVDNYPLAYDSYSALVALVNAGVPVSDLNRGLVDYFAKQYGYALDAFQRYNSSNPQNDGTVVYYKALTYYYLGDYENAVSTWELFIENYPDNPHWVDAWDGNGDLPGIAYTQWYWLDQSDAAVQTLLSFVQKTPNDASAPAFLMDAARIQERDGKLEEAASTWERVANDYPGSELVPQALFWTGITRFRLGKYSDSLVAFQRDAILSTLPEDQARADFWIGKSQQVLGDNASAKAAWQRTASIDPTDYYSLRAQDMLFNRVPFTLATPKTLAMDLEVERKDAEAWLRVTFQLAPGTDLSGLGSFHSDPRIIRGTEMLALGLGTEASAEFDNLASEIANNAADTYRLANYLLSLGMYYPAIFAFRRVLTLAGMSTQAQTLGAPIFFNHIRYGLYYLDIVVPAAKQTGFDPLFVLSVIRQESLFDNFAASPYAIGLMQITPDTGQLTAENLGWPVHYKTADLTRPLVSITLGTTYLLTQKNNTNGNLFTVLASYNAGPNASPIWRNLSGPDSDLFVEVIRSEETRDYLRSIYEIYSMYHLLYPTLP